MTRDPLYLALERLDTAGDDVHVLLSSLRALKTALIGNKARKLICCQDVARLTRLARRLSHPAEDAVGLELTTQIASIFGILSTPIDEVLLSLMLADIPSALWTVFRQTLSSAKGVELPSRQTRDVLVALLRAIKSFYVSLVQLVGPRSWGAITLAIRESEFGETVRAGKMRARIDQFPVLAKAALTEAFMHDNVISLLKLLATSTRAFTVASMPAADGETSLAPPQQAAAASWHLSVAQLCAEIIWGSVRTRDQQVRLLGEQASSLAALAALMQLVDCGHARVEEIALNALSAVAYDFPEAASAVLLAAIDTRAGGLSIILSRLDSRSSSLQIAAAQCAAHLLVANREDQPYHKTSSRAVISVLLRLVADREGRQAEAASTLAYIVHENEAMQCLACELGAMRTLAETLASEDERMCTAESGDAIMSIALTQECLLMSIARLAALRDDIRRRVSEEKLLTPIIEYLRSTSVALRIAACECVKALSRSANMLRTGLVEAGAADPLCERLNDDEDDRVRVVAIAAVSNLVCDFSPMKEILVAKNTIPRFVEITKTTSGNLRLNALIALVNVSYWSDSVLKRVVMNALGWDYLVTLIQDTDFAIQDQALCFLRNLACNTEPDITMTVAGIGEARLYNLLEEKLRSSNDAVVTQAIYVLVNIATGNEFQKKPILHRPGITRGVLAHMTNPNDIIRVGAVWCIHNLARGVHENVVRLRSLGFEARLRDLADDLSLDVREQVSETLAVFAST